MSHPRRLCVSYEPHEPNQLCCLCCRKLWPRKLPTNANQRYTQHTLSEFITNEVNTFVECHWAVYVPGWSICSSHAVLNRMLSISVYLRRFSWPYSIPQNYARNGHWHYWETHLINQIANSILTEIVQTAYFKWPNKSHIGIWKLNKLHKCVTMDIEMHCDAYRVFA